MCFYFSQLLYKEVSALLRSVMKLQSFFTLPASCKWDATQMSEDNSYICFEYIGLNRGFEKHNL